MALHDRNVAPVSASEMRVARAKYAEYLRIMSNRSFGQQLGLLIRQKRRVQGLTQVQLAEDAYGTSGKARRISELESGSVANPHPATIDPIIVALGISDAEIEECAKASPPRSDDDLDRAYREARNLIEAISRQFEHAQPDASLAELDAFLRAKAAEWLALRKRIENIDAEKNALAEIKRDAARALAEGRFDDVDALLARAEEEYQLNRTLNEVRNHAAIRISRGDGSLLRGDTEAALRFYTSAVEFYRPFDEREMAREINEISERIYEISRTAIRPVFFIAVSLLELLIELDHIKESNELLAEAHYRLGLCCRNEHDNNFLPDKTDDILSKAIKYSTLAFDSASAQGNLYQKTVSAIGLANCLRDRGKNSDVGDLKRAIDILNSAQSQCTFDGNTEHLLPIIFNSLGAIYRHISDLSDSDEAFEANNKGFNAFTQAIIESEKYCNIDVWGASHFNLAAILEKRASDSNKESEEKHFLRICAISKVNASIESFPAAAFPFRFADSHRLLGQILFSHAAELQSDELAEVYLLRAAQSFEIAANVVSKERDPRGWANLRLRSGAVYEYHSYLAEIDIGLEDLKTAIGYYEEAAEVFEAHAWDSDLMKCREEISRAETCREALLEKDA